MPKPIQHSETGVYFGENILGSVFCLVDHAREASLLLFINLLIITLLLFHQSGITFAPTAGVQQL